jgi:hypothetical protein
MRSLTVASLGLALAGCGTSGQLATFQKGDAAISVKLPVACDRFLRRVRAPKVTADSDAGEAFTAASDALDKANARLSTARKCRTDERKAYGTPK